MQHIFTPSREELINAAKRLHLQRTTMRSKDISPKNAPWALDAAQKPKKIR